MRPSQSVRLYTIGYQGRSLEEVIGVLQQTRIDTVIDVRAIPVSRRAMFSKAILSKVLSSKGIRYMSVPDLGAAKRLRESYGNGDFADFAREYGRAVLVSRHDKVLQLAQIVLSRQACLLCYEARPENCHRSLLSAAVAKCIGGDADVIHL